MAITKTLYNKAGEPCTVLEDQIPLMLEGGYTEEPPTEKQPEPDPEPESETQE